MGWGRAVRRALQCGVAAAAVRGPARSMVSAATAGPAPHRTGAGGQGAVGLPPRP